MRILRFHGLTLSIIIISSITIIVVADFLLVISLTLGHGLPDHSWFPALTPPASAAGPQPDLGVAVPRRRAGWRMERKQWQEGSRAPSIHSKVLTVIISVEYIYWLIDCLLFCIFHFLRWTPIIIVIRSKTYQPLFLKILIKWLDNKEKNICWAILRYFYELMGNSNWEPTSYCAEARVYGALNFRGEQDKLAKVFLMAPGSKNQKSNNGQ